MPSNSEGTRASPANATALGDLRGPAPTIRTEGLGVSYRNRQVLADVDLIAPAGLITAIVGPSGCGKSSCLAAIQRLTDVFPGARVVGEVRIDGVDVYGARVDAVAHRRRVGMIFQRPNPFPMSIRRNLSLALRDHGVRDRRALDDIGERVLRDVGLWDEVKDRLDEPAGRLSGGQQQRLCFARALALDPEALLLDEPCSSLDPISASVVEDLLARLRGRYTLLLVTHDLAQARRLADQLAVFWVIDGVGRLVEQGPAARVFGAPSNASAARYLAGLGA
jgi:phosphate transport system ATP-binding protein